MNKLQKKVQEVYEKNFGYTPLSERLNDIQKECFELLRWTDVKNLKEEAGDLLSTLIQLHNENGWDIEENLDCNLIKINKRYLQYKSLGRKVKVAILGGAFDPITNGHIQTAKFVLNTSGEFDEVWLMPSYNHMMGKEMTDSKHRLEMCKLASQTDGRIKVFDYEIENQLSGETYNLFKRLKQSELNENINFSMIIGLDNANYFDKWVNYQELERMTRFVVVPRKGVDRDLSVDWYLKEPHIFLNNESDIMEISSTMVRDEIKLDRNSKKLEKWIDPNVMNYINDNKLY
ncbi:MAG: nicotinate (nicotinamide) nucleotide adenylyltransferase [bacterium]